MSLKNTIFVLFVSIWSFFSVGCGGSVAPGVADGPDTPPMELTPEEVKGEQEAMREARQQ